MAVRLKLWAWVYGTASTPPIVFVCMCVCVYNTLTAKTNFPHAHLCSGGLRHCRTTYNLVLLQRTTLFPLTSWNVEPHTHIQKFRLTHTVHTSPNLSDVYLRREGLGAVWGSMGRCAAFCSVLLCSASGRCYSGDLQVGRITDTHSRGPCTANSQHPLFISPFNSGTRLSNTLICSQRGVPRVNRTIFWIANLNPEERRMDLCPVTERSTVCLTTTEHARPAWLY